MAFYRFDGELYTDTEAGRQALLEAINNALETEAWSDSEEMTVEERQEAVSMSYDGTHYAAPFWDNIMAIMQQAPYPVNVERVDLCQLSAEEREVL